MEFKPYMKSDYGKLADKVNLLPDFFTGFQPERREEIVSAEAKFYHSITEPYSVDDRVDKFYTGFTSYDGCEIKMKVYMPKNITGAIPGWVFAHGGGWMTCSVETHDFVPSYVAANAGIVCFSIEYRLAPEHKFPTGFEDCYAAIKHIAANAENYHVDTARISVGGDSSGGNYAAALALMARDRKEIRLDKQVLIYPATDLTGTVKKASAEVYAPVGASDDAPAVSFSEIYCTEPKEAFSPYVSMLLADDLRGLPPALFIQAECDSLCDDGLMYAQRLHDAGVAVECEIYKGMPHAFILRTYEETFAALDRICAYLR